MFLFSFQKSRCLTRALLALVWLTAASHLQAQELIPATTAQPTAEPTRPPPPPAPIPLPPPPQEEEDDNNGINIDINSLLLGRNPLTKYLTQELESGVRGSEVAKRLGKGIKGKNMFRGGSDIEPVENMKRLFEPVLLGGGDPDKALATAASLEAAPEIDQWHSPHLRDILFKNREAIVTPWRSKARDVPGVPCATKKAVHIGACPPPTCIWFDEHKNDPIVASQCCSGAPPSHIYAALVQDSNFKTCCVRRPEEFWLPEALACKYPMGDGWAGLFEYYYPTTVVGWENDRTTTMIAKKEEVSAVIEKSMPLMKSSEAVNWVKDTMRRGKEMDVKLGFSVGGASVSVDADDIIRKTARELKDTDRELQFADSLQSEGLTMRPNFASLDPVYRRALATHFCMHPDQFMKIMDNNPIEDPLQMQYDGLLAQIPIWANYSPEGINLMTNPAESIRVFNFDETPTNFFRGFVQWAEDPLFCQRMNLDNPLMRKLFGKVLASSGGTPLREAAVGFTCREGGNLNGSMVPLELYRHAAIERRAAIADHVLGFMIAGGLYEGGMRQGARSYYKRFEPRPYSKQMGLLKGISFNTQKGDLNEKGLPCTDLSGENLRGRDLSDMLYISNVTHDNKADSAAGSARQGAFTQEKIRAETGGEDGFNRKPSEWAEKDKKDRLANKRLDEESSNYATAYRMFATCPRGYTRWHPPAHNEGLAELCGAENLGGLPLEP